MSPNARETWLGEVGLQSVCNWPCSGVADANLLGMSSIANYLCPKKKRGGGTVYSISRSDVFLILPSCYA